MAHMNGTIYNSTDGPLVIDDEGHVLASREHRTDVELDTEPVAGHLAAGRLVIPADPEPVEQMEPSTSGGDAGDSTEGNPVEGDLTVAPPEDDPVQGPVAGPKGKPRKPGPTAPNPDAQTSTPQEG